MVEKAPDAFRTISEVADDLDLPQHVLRFWETRFQQIKPMKRGGGRRYYRPDDIDAAARHPASALRRGLHDPRRAAHPEGSRHQVRPERLAAGRRPAGARRTGAPSRRSPSRRRRRRGRRPAGGAPRRTRRIAACSACCRRSCAAASTRSASPRAARPTRRTGRSRRRRATVLASRGRRLPAEKLRKLQDTLRELQECRKLLDAAHDRPDA